MGPTLRFRLVTTTSFFSPLYLIVPLTKKKKKRKEKEKEKEKKKSHLFFTRQLL
jgi:hypothetical protein